MSKTSTTDTRNLLIETGINVMVEKGYNNTGLSEVLQACNVPKGSFYHYFKSKEDFGLQIINTYDERYISKLCCTLGGESTSPLNKLLAYIDETIEQAQQRQCSRGCLLANLSQEMADQNELFRVRLKEILCKRREFFARLIAEAKEKGDIRLPLDPIESAEFFLCALEGALARSKVQKDLQPLFVIRQFIFGVVFGRPDLLIENG